MEVLSFAITSLGVPLGAHMPCQKLAWIFGTPRSSSVGTSGAAHHCFGESTAPSNDPYRRVCDQRDRLQVVDDIVWKIHGQSVEHVGLRVANTQGVTVGRGTNDTPNGNATACTTDILANHSLTKRNLHSLSYNTRSCRLARLSGTAPLS
jgi:hypothetical protein